MNNIIWKAFKIGNIFERSTKLALGVNQKDLNLCEEKDDNHGIALISASRIGSGCVGYIKTADVDEKIASINKITFDDQWGYTFFQQEKFVITGGHNAILEMLSEKLKTLLDKNLYCYSFLSLILNTTTIKTGIYGYGYKINNKFDREIILLPCLEITSSDEYIWEENGHYYTLAVDYIKKLMGKSKELREQKTIRLYEAERAKYEAERAKYEAERAKYEAGYLKEKNFLVWKGFRLDEFFNNNTGRDSSIAQKNLTKSSIKDEEFFVSIITESTFNNGVGFFMKADDPVVEGNIVEKGLTYGTQFGNCNWHNYPYFIIGNVNYLSFSSDKMYELCNDYVGQFFARVISKIFKKSKLFGYGNKIDQTAFGREMILLPFIECSQEYSIWDVDGKFYTLAVDYISYMYLSGKVNYNQKLANNYTYQY